MELSTGLNTASGKLPGGEQEFIQAAVLIFTTLLHWGIQKCKRIPTLTVGKDKDCLGYMRGNNNFEIQQVDMGKISSVKR